MQTKSAGKSLEVRAKSVDLAIEKGLSELGIRRDEAEITVLREGSRGVLGIGAEDAVVRIAVKAPPTAAPAPAVEPQPAARPPSPPSKVAGQPSPQPAASGEEEEEGEPAVLDIEERVRVREIARKALQELLGHMGITAHVEAAEQGWQSANVPEDAIVLNVTGADLGVLIGRRGETLDDIQFITRLMVSREIQKWPNIVVDVEYYKARREKLLTDLAQRMAERVRATQQPVALEPMPASERRIVHLALRDAPGVYTESSGEGQKRKVVILPRP